MFRLIRGQTTCCSCANLPLLEEAEEEDVGEAIGAVLRLGYMLVAATTEAARASDQFQQLLIIRIRSRCLLLLLLLLLPR